MQVLSSSIRSARTLLRTANPWPVALIAFFAFFITLVISFAVFAIQNDVELVRSDYYTHEILFQQEIDRFARANTLGDAVSVRFDGTSKELTVKIPVSHLTADFQGKIQLYRPSDSALDCNMSWSIEDKSVRAIDVSHLRPGPWRVKLEWCSSNLEYAFHQTFDMTGKSKQP